MACTGTHGCCSGALRCGPGTDQGETPLPPDIVKRFDGKVIAIQGYEQDQVMVTPVGKPGVNPEKDVSVPINWAYNHVREALSLRSSTWPRLPARC